MNYLAVLLQDQTDLSTAQHALMVMVPIFMLVGIIFLAIIIIPFWFICKKAGFSPWLSLLNIVPMGNLILIYSAGLCAVEGGAGATDGVSAAVSATAAATAAVRR